MDNSMKRKQFHLTHEDDRLLKELASDKGCSEAEIVRDAIREYALREKPVRNPLLEMAEEAERYSIDSAGDTSVKHDGYLVEMYENEKK